MTSRYSRRQPLPEGLGPGERDFFVELRRMVDAASLTYRELERKTSTVRTDAADPAFYSKSQWARWLNGQAMPPHFTGRATELAALAALADLAVGAEASAPPGGDIPGTGSPHPAGSGATEVVVIAGTAGVGKTTLANY